MNDRKKRNAAAALDPADIISTNETAELTGLKPGTLATLRREDKGPEFFKIGYRTVRYSRRAVLAWIAERRVTPGAVPVRAERG